MRILLPILLALSLVSCASTEQGKSIQRAHNIDAVTTAIALAAGAEEANPIMACAIDGNIFCLPVVVLKFSFGYLFESDVCINNAKLAAKNNAVIYGISSNNLLIAASVTNSIALASGGVIGGLYYYFREDIEPDVFDCSIPDNVTAIIDQYVIDFNNKDHVAIGELFTEDAVTPNAHRRIHIAQSYKESFEQYPDFIIKLDKVYKVKDGWWIADFLDPYDNYINFKFKHSDEGITETNM